MNSAPDFSMAKTSVLDVRRAKRAPLCGANVMAFLWADYPSPEVRGRSCQKATAAAAATFRESTWWNMGIRTV